MMRSISLLLLLVTSLQALRHQDEVLFDLIRHASDSVPVRSFTGQRQESRRRLHTPYINACHNPDLLYVGTEASGKCICDEENSKVDRILCIVEGISCSQALCTEEHDIWIFDKRTGKMEARSTCVVCADEGEACESYDDICFNAKFDDEEQMTECSVLLQDSKPLTSCSECAPCLNEGRWGMEFDCFDGRWDSRGTCIIGSRVGHFPEFPVRGDTGFVEEIERNDRNDEDTKNQDTRNQTNNDAKIKNDTQISNASLISAAMIFGLGLGIFISLVSHKPRRALPMEDAVDMEEEQTATVNQEWEKMQEQRRQPYSIVDV